MRRPKWRMGSKPSGRLAVSPRRLSAPNTPYCSTVRALMGCTGR